MGVQQNPGVEVVTIEEYEKITGEPFDPEEDFMYPMEVKGDLPTKDLIDHIKK